MSGITFGTDGWRAIIADEFTFANVGLVAQAIAKYVQDAGLADRGIVIGYDNRFLSERFAAVVAEVMAGNGICTWFPRKAVPTPVTAFTIKDLGAGGGVMITASHNPPEYNGIKFIPEYGGPAVPEITKVIEKNIAALRGADGVRILSRTDAQDQGLLRDFDPKPAYLAHLKQLIDYKAISKSNLRVVIDPMWGAGIGYVEDALQEGCSRVEIIHNYRDVLCEGMLPEPTATGLADLSKAVRERKADLGLALDGDADRFGIIDSAGNYVTPNEVLYLLLYYTLEFRRWRGAVARSVATTHMLDRIAEDFGLPVVETPVGFKYIAQSLIHHRSMLGGEESGGLSVQGHVPEKDGILALLLVVEMVAARKKSLRNYQAEITEKYGRLVSARMDLQCDPARKEEVLAVLAQWSPQELNGEPVAARNTIDGVKIILESGHWILIRPSGTEPLFRIYVEASDQEKLGSLQESARTVLGL